MTEKRDRHYPLGFWSGASEIQDNYGAEAEAIGVITILWNCHEQALKAIFARLLSPQDEFANLLWDSENTNRGRLKLLTLVRDGLSMSEERQSLLGEVITRTGTLAEQRNALAHAEYVVDMDAQVLMARTQRRSKGALVRPSDLDALNRIIRDLEVLDRCVSALRLDLIPQELKDTVQALAAERAEVFSDRE